MDSSQKNYGADVIDPEPAKLLADLKQRNTGQEEMYSLTCLIEVYLRNLTTERDYWRTRVGEVLAENAETMRLLKNLTEAVAADHRVDL